MTTPRPSVPSTWRHAKFTHVLIIGCWVLYALLSLLSPAATNNHFHLSQLTLTLLRLSIILPVLLIWLLIWLLAARGAATIKLYAASIQGDGHETKALNRIGDGLIWTLVYLVSTSLAGVIIPYFAHTPLLQTLILIRNHISPLTALIAFSFIYQGSQQLKAIANFVTWTTQTFFIIAGFALFSIFFVLEFTTSSPSATDSSGVPLSILPHEVLLFTAVLPFILAWFLGILAIINLYNYTAHVGGILYRAALKNLALGTGVIIVFTMSHQLLIFAARFLTNLGLTSILLIIYLLLALYAVGFSFVRQGAKKLMQIEAVQ